MEGSFDRLKAALADRYDLRYEIGAGGMATVYLADDVKHRRKVAVKVLRPELSAVIGGERFLQEIELTAGLQHPNILPLYDSGEADTFLYYVMPYVEGESLRDRLVREHQLGVEDTIGVAKDVGAALEYAHSRGVVHRDIKPENILMQGRQALVADFGIALAVSHAGGTRLTETGLSLGTPHYMSPEQAMGDRALDARSDVYSLGCMVYEMLAGEPPHVGNSVQAIIGKILSDQPSPVTQTRSLVPAYIDAVLLKALAKSPADRFATAGEFVDALSNPNFTLPPGLPVVVPETAAAERRRPSIAAGVAAAALVALLVVSVLWLRSASTGAPPPVVRLSVNLPAAQTLRVAQDGPGFAVSADGTRLVYVGPGTSGNQIWVRDLGQLDATPVRGSQDACCPVFSPDGQSVAFLTGGLELRVQSLTGGVGRTVVDSGLVEHTLYGGSLDWGDDGYLYVSGTSGLARVSEDGGPLEMVSTLDAGRGDRVHAWADVLPGGRGALVTIVPQDLGDRSAYTVGVADFSTNRVEVLVQGMSARYAKTGHLVYGRDDGVVLAVPFDERRMELTGVPTPVASGVRIRNLGVVDFAFSDTGTLLYGTGTVSERRLVWVDRNGEAAEVEPGWIGGFNTVAVSPDGSRLAVSIESADGPQDVWIKPMGGGAPAKLSFGGMLNWRLAFTPDGRSVSFVSDRSGDSRLYVKPIDGGADATRLVTAEDRPVFEGIWSPDGRWLVYRTDNQAPGNGDIMAVRLDEDGGEPVSVVASPAEEVAPALSPDGRWLAYVSDESGRREVYVRPFPPDEGSKWQISTGGASEPMWARGGGELFYRDRAGDLIAVDVATVPTFAPGGPRALFSAGGYHGNEFHHIYDVAPDDERFLMIRLATVEGGELIWVQGWFEELRGPDRD